MKSILALLFLLLTNTAQAACVGRMINPLSDVCWECLFPMTLGGFEIGARDANESSTQDSIGPVCTCFPEVDKFGAKIPVGIPFSFWEPARLVEVTRTPGCLMVLNGTTLPVFKPHMKGGPSTMDTGSKHSFYHVHWFIFPVLSLFNILTEQTVPGVELKPCVDQGEFDVWMTEFDPTWNDETLDNILSPEVFLFNNLIAQAACIGDCIKASITTPIDALFWCGGCQGSLYPFTGTVSSHISGVQASLLLTQRLIAKRHRMGLEVDTSNPDTLCAPELRMRIKKTQYKTQMIYPKTRQSCQPLGRSDVLWAAGTEYPHGGEDFSYLLWRKRACCLQARANWNPIKKVVS